MQPDQSTLIAGCGRAIVSRPARLLQPLLDELSRLRFSPATAVREGLRARVDGRLLATGTSKHLCRRNPAYEAELARAREMGLVPSGD